MNAVLRAEHYLRELFHSFREAQVCTQQKDVSVVVPNDCYTYQGHTVQPDYKV